MFALDDETVTAKPPERVLFVDDERKLLNGITRNLGREFHIVTALGPKKGLSMIDGDGPFGVIVSDMQMPEMDGAAFLAKARRKNPDAVRILLTGQASVAAAQRAINRGGVHKYITKPCPADKLRTLLTGAIDEHRRKVAEQRVLEQTVQGSVEMLTEILALLRPAALGRAMRMRHYVRHMCEQTRPPESWRFVTAAMLSQIGTVLLPNDLIVKTHGDMALTEEEAALVAQTSATAFRLVSKVPRLEEVASLVAGRVTGEDDEDLRTGAAMLRLATRLDEHVLAGKTLPHAVGTLRQQGDFPAELLHALSDIPPVAELTLSRHVRANELVHGMVVDQDVYTAQGVLLVSVGQSVDPRLAERVSAIAKTVGVSEPIRVLVNIDHLVTATP